MKDFDTERRERQAAHEEAMGDRSFVVGGETFVYRGSSSYTVLGQIGNDEEMSPTELIGIMEQALLKMIEPGQEERFLAAIRSDTDPLTFGDLTALVRWLTEQQTERPTQAPSPSTSGDVATSTSSTEDSSTEPAVASAA